MASTKNTNLAVVVPKPLSPNEVHLTNRPIPSPGPNDLLVRTHAFASNPVDWKLRDEPNWLQEESYPLVFGSDTAGTVESVGSSVTNFKAGDRVTGFGAVIWNQQADHGSAQQYVLLRDDAATKIPDDLPFEDASVFPMAWATAGRGLFDTAGISRPSASNRKPGNGKGLLVWGAASSVGSMVLQIAKDLGFTIFATASARNHEWLRKLGADVLVDYKDKDVVEKLVNAAQEHSVKITYGYDTISEDDTFSQSLSVLEKARRGEQARLVVTLPWPEKLVLPEGITQQQTMAFACWVPDPSFGAWLFNDYLRQGLAEKRFVSAPEVEIIDGGLEAVPGVWDRLKKGVSGKKLVVQVK